MTETYFNPLADGNGLEGLMNWSNNYSNGWMINLFIGMVFIVSTYVLSKSEWKMSNVLTFTFLLSFLLSMIASLFVSVNGYLIFFSSMGFIVALVWSFIDRR